MGISSILADKTTYDNDVHSLKIESPNLIILSGIMIFFKDEHRSNAQEPISLTVFEITMFFNKKHSEKAFAGILKTPSGIVK